MRWTTGRILFNKYTNIHLLSFLKSCDNYWCNTKFSNKWSGPGEEGYVIEPGGNKRVLDPSKVRCQDNNQNCREWAQRDSKECETNAAYMHATCPRSCNVCSLSTPDSSSDGGSDEL